MFLRELLKDRFYSGVNDWLNQTLGPAVSTLAVSALWIVWMVLFGGALLAVWWLSQRQFDRSEPSVLTSLPTLRPSPPPPALAELSSPLPPRQLSPYEVERKLRHLDKVKAAIEEMQPLINDGLRLQSNGWNAFAKPQVYPSYKEELVKYRDELNDMINRLEVLADVHPEYDEVATIVRPLDRRGIINAIERYLIRYMHLSSTIKSGISPEVFHELLSPHAESFGAAAMGFLHWQNNAHANIVGQIRALSSR
jgi:hypothetical protein